MKTSRIFLGVGSNLGDRMANLTAAQSAVAAFMTIEKTSKIYETAPWGMLDQPDFLNQAWDASTTLTPLELLQRIQQVEIDLGRKPSVLYGPRLIDIDILLYSNLIFKSADLVIPHPYISERTFVLAPMADLEPDLIIPGLLESVQKLLDRHDTQDINVAK
ncbi:MAG: 2-amino-4-hydroxy-6-hydroxymethyldihydropteridine diphosphokinase [Leptolinea sp.]